MSLDNARSALYQAARLFAQQENTETERFLCNTASSYAAERIKAAPRAQTKEATSLTMPFGKDKGLPLSEAKTGNLRWMAEVLRESIADETKAKWRNSNQTLLEAIERELESR